MPWPRSFASRVRFLARNWTPVSRAATGRRKKPGSGAHWMQTTLAPAEEAPPAAVLLFFRRPTDSGRAVDYLRSRFSPRFEALFRYQHELSSNLLVTVNHAVAAIWVTAREAEDLQPAVRLMDETLAQFRPNILTDKHPFASTPPPSEAHSLMPHVPRFAAIDKFKDFYSIVHPDPPFLLPDPAVDPERFRAMWRYYVALQHDTAHSFFQEESVRVRIDTLERQYKRNAEEAWAAVDKAFSENASAEILSAALKRAEPFTPLPAFQMSPNAPRPGFFPLPATPAPSSPKPVGPDYRTTAEPWLNRSPDPNEDFVRRRKQRYEDWIAYRQAQEAGDQKEAARLAQQLRSNLDGYPAEFAGRIRDELKRTPFSLSPGQ